MTMNSTERLLLRHWRESDLDFLRELRNDITLQARLLSTARGSDIAAVRRWLERRTATPDDIFFVVSVRENEVPIGYIQCTKEANSTNGFRAGICLADGWQSRGYGPEVMLWLERHLAANFMPQKIILHVDVDNHQAVACYRKLAYREVGVMKSHVKVGNDWRDVLVMEKLLPDIGGR